MPEKVQENNRPNENQEDLQRWYQDIQRLSDETNPIFEKEATDVVEKSRELMEETLNFTLNSKYCDSLLDTAFLPERKEQLIDLAVAVYMQAWLKGDSNAQQNIHSFVTQKYVPKNSPQKRGKIDIDEELARKYWRYLREELFRQKSYRLQQTYDKSMFDDASHVKEEFTYAKPFDFMMLWKADASATGKTDLLKLYLDRKEPFGIKPRLETMESAYRNYYRIFESITPGSDDETAMGDIEYTVTSMMAHEIEYTNHFHLAATISKYLSKKKIGLNLNDNAEKIRRLWARIDSVEGELISGKNGSIPYLPYDIFHYDEDVECLFQQGEQVEIYIQKRRSDIITLRNIILMAVMSHPSCTLPHWREMDYAAARDFFQNCLPVYSVYSKSQICKEAGERGYRMSEEEFCFIRSFYKLWLEMPVEGSTRDKIKDRRDNRKNMKWYREKLKS